MSAAPGIDHIVLCVRDLSAAGERFRSMGFTLTPPATHPFGTGNSLAQMRSSFVELLSVVDPARIPPHDTRRFSFAAHNAEFLSRREGMSMLVLSSEDARADEARWREAGLKTFEPVYFERNARLPDGSEAKVAFTIAFVVNERMPNTVFFCCQQHAPEAFWQPEYQRHVNGAENFSSVTLSAEDPCSHAAFFQALFGESRVEIAGETLHIHTVMGEIDVLSPGAVSRRFAGVSGLTADPKARFVGAGIQVSNLDAVEACFQQSGVDHLWSEDRVVVPPSACFGLALEFVKS